MKLLFDAKIACDLDCFLVAKDDVQGAKLPLDSADLVRKAAAASRFEGAAGQVFEIFVSQDGKDLRVVLLGVGEANRENLEKAGGALTAKYLRSGVTSIALRMDGGSSLPGGADAGDILSGAYLRAWNIDKYRTKLSAKAKVSLDTLNVVGGGDLEAGWANRLAIAEGVAFTRELTSEPANIIYPESFVERCRHLADLGIEIVVLDDKQMAELGMGALLGVAQGSRKPARLLCLKWNGTGSADTKPLVIVGKGVTFDTGGISIKPAQNMEDMKWDMGGAGIVAGTMKALAGRKAKAHVIGVCGLVENMPDGNAQRPGDVVTSMSGQTIEVINTDAEGRLVLCDALHWAQEQFSPEYIIDLATLTGAMIIALGSEHAGVFSNDNDFAEKLLDAGRATGDPVWHMPIGRAYDKLIDSPIADMKNVGPRGAGAITAAQFLHRFIHKGVKWAHLDVAGVVWSEKPGPVWDKGATGYGVRLLNRLVAEHFES